MKILRKGDKHNFILGVFASITAVIVWDIIKSKYKLLNYKIDNDIKKI
jgi:hypothetical protein